MRTFKKSNFLEEYKTPLIECACEGIEDEETIEELVNADATPIGGSVPDGNEANIQTGPIQKPKKAQKTSNYVKGIATTTDDVRAKTSQGPDWQAAYGGLGGTYYSHGRRVNTGSWVPWVGGSHGLVGDMDLETPEGGVGIGEGLEEAMTKMVEKMLTKKDDEISIKKVDLDLSKKAHIDDLIDKIKDLDPDAKKKLEKLLSDAESRLTK